MKNRVIFDLVDLSDCKKLDDDVKYITVDIKNVDVNIISYLMNNENKCLITDRIDNKYGYMYVDYVTFFKGQSVIDKIVENVPKGLSKLEIARYLYISLGKVIGYDINLSLDKNSYLSLNNIKNTNNIWSSLANGRASNVVLAKIYLYLCSFFNIKCDIIYNGDDDFVANRITIDNDNLVVDLSRDVALIQAGFPTKYFSSYNDNHDVDEKIGYIKKNYNDFFIDRVLSSINFMDENMVIDILIKTQKILKVNEVKPFELGLIYKYIFDKYCPNYDIFINNMYVNSKYHEHFILISYNDMHYGYNYDLKSFMVVDNSNLINNLDSNKICLYGDEFIPNLERKNIVL